jgi:hypothetical protein
MYDHHWKIMSYNVINQNDLPNLPPQSLNVQ